MGWGWVSGLHAFAPGVGFSGAWGLNTARDGHGAGAGREMGDGFTERIVRCEERWESRMNLGYKACLPCLFRDESGECFSNPLQVFPRPLLTYLKRYVWILGHL